jgi:TatD DNase family protein
MTPFDLIDSHAHLDFPDFDPDRPATLDRARAAGVRTVLTIGSGSGPENFRTAIPLAEQFPDVFAAIGIHPQDSSNAREEHFIAIEPFARHPRVLAWGEIGLDYYRDYAPHDLQQRVFLRQLEIAAAARLPVIIHCRAAWDDTLRLLDAHWRPTGLGGILHCFSGTRTDARRGLDLGFHISFAANITYPKAHDLRHVAAALPAACILTETDSPFLPPQAFRGKRNEPAHVLEVARTLANVRDCAAEEIAATAAANFRRLFGLNSDGIRASSR